MGTGFAQMNRTNDFKIGMLLITLSGACHCRLSARTAWLCNTTLWFGKTASLM